MTQPKLVMLDKVEYLTLDGVRVSLLFQLICKRYEKSPPLVLTSNKAFAEWGQIFGEDMVMTSAILGRLLHRARVLNI